MPHLRFSSKALDDLNRFRAFLKVKDSEVGRRAVATIRARLEVLVHSPRIGRPADDFFPGLREWTIRFGSSGYVALYRMDGDNITIIAMRHMREDGYRLD